jgi:integrase
MRWRDVDFGGTVHVVRNAPASAPAGSGVKAPKSGKARSVPLADAAAAAFDRVSKHLAAHGLANGPEDLVFQTREGGMLDDGRVRDAFYAALSVAGLGHLRAKDNPMTLHDLRHTFGTLAVRMFPISDVQAYMGHANIQTTMRYVHHVPRPDAAAKLTAAFAVDMGETTTSVRASV